MDGWWVSLETDRAAVEMNFQPRVLMKTTCRWQLMEVFPLHYSFQLLFRLPLQMIVVFLGVTGRPELSHNVCATVHNYVFAALVSPSFLWNIFGYYVL